MASSFTSFPAVSKTLHRNKNRSTNYKTWKKEMLRLIGSQSLLAYIDGTTPPPPNDGQGYAAWRQTDDLVKDWILRSIAVGDAPTVVNLDSAKDVWLELENQFSNRKPAVAAEQGTNHLCDTAAQTVVNIDSLVSKNNFSEPTPAVAVEQGTNHLGGLSDTAAQTVVNNNSLQLGNNFFEPTPAVVAEQAGLVDSSLTSSAVNAVILVWPALRRHTNRSTNYKTWKKEMLSLIGSRSLLAYVDGTTPPPPKDGQGYAAWRQTDNLVKGWILGGLSDSAAQTVVSFDTARDVWLQLENNFSNPTPAVAAEQEMDWHKHLPLYKAALNGEWKKIKQLLVKDRNALKARVANSLDTALHVAVAVGGSGEKSTSFVVKLVESMSDEWLAITNKYGYNALHIAARTGNLSAVRILVRRHPGLLYIASEKGFYPVHLAADSAQRETLEFLMFHTRDDHHPNPFDNESGLTLLSFLINADYFDMAVRLVEKYPSIARIRTRPHYSALMFTLQREKAFSVEAHLNPFERIIYYCIQVAVEMESKGQHPYTNDHDIDKYPSCAREIRNWWRRRVVVKLYSAVFKVIQQLGVGRALVSVPQVKRLYDKNLIHRNAQRLLKSICKHMESLKSKEAANIYSEAMLRAATLGIGEVIEAIVETFPPAIFSWDASIGQNFLHLAVKNRSESVFNLMYQTGNHRFLYSDMVDTSGNNTLHLAATLAPTHKLNLVSGAALQMQREIQWFNEADKFISPSSRLRLNKANKTPKQVFTEEHKDLKLEGERWMKDTANSFTITAGLIVTIVFAAAITVPGGNESSGYPVFLGTKLAFTIFAVSDAISLFTSTTSLLMFLSILTSRYAEQDFLYALPKRLCIGLVTLFISILFMMVAFGSTLYLVFGSHRAWILIPVAALASLPISAFVLLQFPLLYAVISSTYGRGIFGKQSDRQFH